MKSKTMLFAIMLFMIVTTFTYASDDALVEIESYGDDEYRLTYTDVYGARYSVPLSANVAGKVLTGDDDNRLHLREAQSATQGNIADDDYFVINNGKKSKIYRYEDYDSTNRVVTFEDISTGLALEVAVNSQGVGYLISNGLTHKVVVKNPTELQPKIAVDLNANGYWNEFVRIFTNEGIQIYTALEQSSFVVYRFEYKGEYVDIRIYATPSYELDLKLNEPGRDELPDMELVIDDYDVNELRIFWADDIVVEDGTVEFFTYKQSYDFDDKRNSVPKIELMGKVKIVMEHLDESFTKTFYSDSSGHVPSTPMPSGDYRVIASKNDYYTQDFTMTVKPAEHKVHRFYMVEYDDVDPETSSVEFYVYTEVNGRQVPLQRVDIEIYNNKGFEVESKTDFNGKGFAYYLPVGDYTADFNLDGYAEARAVFGVYSDFINKVEVYMQPEGIVNECNYDKSGRGILLCEGQTKEIELFDDEEFEVTLVYVSDPGQIPQVKLSVDGVLTDALEVGQEGTIFVGKTKLEVRANKIDNSQRSGRAWFTFDGAHSTPPPGQFKLAHGDSNVHRLYGKDYEVTFLWTDGRYAKFAINGELTDSIREGGRDRLTNGVEIKVHEIYTLDPPYHGEREYRYVLYSIDVEKVHEGDTKYLVLVGKHAPTRDVVTATNMAAYIKQEAGVSFTGVLAEETGDELDELDLRSSILVRIVGDSYVLSSGTDSNKDVVRSVSKFMDSRDIDRIFSLYNPGIREARRWLTEPIDEEGFPIEDDRDDFPEVPEEELSCDDGCFLNGRCVDYGIRTKNGDAKYCGLSGEFELQKSEDAACQNNFECVSNQCSSGACIDLGRQLQENRSLLERIIGWLGIWF